MKKSQVPLLAWFAISLVMSAIAQDRVPGFDAYVEKARGDWGVPGMAVVVVQDGNVLLAKGYGVREQGKPTAVDTKTLFGMMSTTKAITAVALGILVDEGKVDPNRPVADYLPEFRVNDPFITSDLRVRDLLTHNSGMGNLDALWAFTPDRTAKEMMDQLRSARPAFSTRGGYVYNNLMYFLAGQVIERASGKPWAQFVKERIFQPLGMNNTFATLKDSGNYPNRSAAHFRIDGTVRSVGEQSADPIAAAGSVWSTADDIAFWLKFVTGDGKPLLKEATFNEMFRPQAILPATVYPTLQLIKPNWTTYGLGWFQHDYRGDKVDFHTGSLAGRTAIIGLLRSKKLGVYVFGNIDHAEVRHALIYKAIDVFVFGDQNGRDWSAEFKKLYDDADAQTERQLQAAKERRLKNTKPSFAPEAYAGRYADPLFGNVTVAFSEGKLRLQVGNGGSGWLEHWQLDTFRIAWDDTFRQGNTLVSFRPSANGTAIEAMTFGAFNLRRLGPAL